MIPLLLATPTGIKRRRYNIQKTQPEDANLRFQTPFSKSDSISLTSSSPEPVPSKNPRPVRNLMNLMIERQLSSVPVRRYKFRAIQSYRELVWRV